MSILSNIKAKIEKERELRKEEKAAFKKAKEIEAKNQAEFKKLEDAKDRIKRIERAEEKGRISAVSAAHRKEQAKEVAKKSAEKAKEGGKELLTFLRKHVEFTPDRKPIRHRKRVLKHKKSRAKRCKRRRY